MGKLIFRAKGKRPFSVSLDDKYIEFLEKQPNRSEAIREALDKLMEEQQPEPREAEEKAEEHEEVELTRWERAAYSWSHREAREIGWSLWGENYDVIEEYPLAHNPELLRGQLRDTRDRCKGTEFGDYLNEILSDEEAFNDLLEKFKRYWAQHHPTPQHLQKEVAPGWKLIDLIKKLGNPEDQELTVHDVAGKLGISYQQVYNSVRPLLEKHGYYFVKKGQD